MQYPHALTCAARAQSRRSLPARRTAQVEIVVHAEVTIVYGRVLPGNDEYGVPLIDQVSHQ